MDTLRAEGLTKVYGEGETVVRAVGGVSLALCAGEVTLIMGPSGSGKTTLLFLLGGLLRPTGGHVWVDGLDLATLSERKLPKVRLSSFGFVFQEFHLLANLTAIENVQIPLLLSGVKREQARERAGRLLLSLGLGNRLDFLPEKLSGGEKQRVSIARGLANRPKVLFADEPTANLDSKAGKHVADLFSSLAKKSGTAVLIVSHDSRIVDAVDRLYLMEDGVLSETGVEAAG